MQSSHLRSASRLSTSYALLAAVWVLFSDRFLGWLVSDFHSLIVLQTYKGWAFVVITATLLFFLLYRDGSRRSRIESALRQSIEQYRTLIKNLPDVAVLLFDHNLRHQIVDGDRQVFSAAGFSKSSVEGKTLWEAFPEQSSAILEPYYRAALAGEIQTWEAKSRETDRSYLCRTMPAYTRGDEIATGFLVCYDLTKQKQIEETLAKSQQRLSLHVQQTPLAVVELDLDCEVVEWNPAAEKIFGFSKNEVIGRNLVDLLLPDAAKAEVHAVWTSLLHKQGGHRNTNENLTKDGRLIVCDWYNTPLVAPDGTVIGVASLVQDVTERHQVEQTLRESEAKFRAVTETTACGIFIYEGTQFVYVNAAAETLTGYSREALTQMNFWDLIHPDYQQIVKERGLARQRGEPVPNRYEFAICTPSGEVRWLDYTATPGIFHFDGKNCALGVAYDITNRKLMEQSLHQAKVELEQRVLERTSELEEANQDLIREIAERSWTEATLRSLYKVTTAHKLTFHQRIQGLLALGRRHLGMEIGMLGQIDDELYTVAAVQIKPRSTFQVSQGDTWSLQDAYCRDVLHVTEPVAFEHAGMSEWCEHPAYINTRLETYIGMPVTVAGKVYGVLSFLSPQPRAQTFTTADKALLKLMCQWVGSEMERQQVEASVRESESRLRSLIDNLPFDCWFRDVDGKYLLQNPLSLERWGNLAGQPLEETSLPPGVIHIWQSNHRRVLAGEIIKEESHQIIQGEPRYFYTILAPVLNGDEIQGSSGVSIDITKRKQAEEKIKAALQREKELSELKTRFISMASHEFRTPLSSIVIYADLLQNYGHAWNEDRKNKTFLRIQEAVKTMTQLMDDVLAIGQAEEGKQDFKPVNLNLSHLAQDLVEQMQLTTQTQCQVVFDSQPSDIHATVDEKIIRQILTNLTSNAIKYSPDGGIVRVSCRYQENVIVLEIKDQGMGIPLEDQENLFEPFYRATNVNRIAGTGLGLVIVKQGVELHQGTISVNSKVGVGTTFTVTLPSRPYPTPS